MPPDDVQNDLTIEQIYRNKLNATESQDQFLSYNDFKTIALKVYGIENHPKADDVFNLAWQYGHSCGYHEVDIYLSDLVELIL